MIDTRCHAHDSSQHGPQGRCQLAAGHEGPHAVMFGRAGVRIVRSWLLRDAVTGVVHLREHVAAQESRPWAPGLPAPAWTDDADIVADPAALPTLTAEPIAAV